MDGMMMDYEKEQSAVKKRIESLSEKVKNNKVMSKMMEESDPEEMHKKHRAWMIVDKAVDAARQHYFSKEDKNIATCLLDLAQVLRVIATSEGVDKQDNSHHNSKKESY